MGPQRVKSVIKDALARGATARFMSCGDNLVHFRRMRGQRPGRCNSRREADLVMTGLQSDDYGYGQTGVILAELLGMPHATIVIEVDASGADKLRVKRELESGWYQWYTMSTPALLTIQSGISQIRYATLKGIMAAKKKEIKEVTPAAEARRRPSHQRIEKIYLPQKTKQTQFLGDGDAKAGAVELWRRSCGLKSVII